MPALKRLILLLSLPSVAWGQSAVATGDSRTVTEPTYPTGCQQVAATKYIKMTNAVNIDPWNATCTLGAGFGVLGCTGGTDYEPSINPPAMSYSAAEIADNTTASGGAGVQTALSGSPSGNCVELIAGASGQNAFVMKPFTIPSNRKLLVDAGIAVFASRSPADYGGGSCGTVSHSGSTSCGTHWITTSGTSNSGIYGLGIFYARGWDTFTTGATTQSWYYQRILTYAVAHGGSTAPYGSPSVPGGLLFTCSAGASGCKSYGPNGIQLNSDTNFTFYKVTLRDSGNFLFNWKGGNGLTAWGMKLIAPFELANTDGWDPLNSINGTFTRGIISNGDNQTALKATSSVTKNISFSGNQTGAGIGLAIGTDIRNGISNVLFNNNVGNGNLYTQQTRGIELTTDTSYAGTVDQVTWQNECLWNAGKTVAIDSTGSSGTSTYTNLLIRNLTVLPSTAPYTAGSCGSFNWLGRSATKIGIQLDNVQCTGSFGGGSASYNNLYKGPGTVLSNILSQFTGGTGNTITGSTSATSAYPCALSQWQQLNGELNIATAASNFNQSYTYAAPFTLQAVVQPTTEISTEEQPLLTGSVQFYDNGAPLGSPVALTGDGFFASLAVSSPSSGTHVYTAKLRGDSYYTDYPFGSVTVINGSPSTAVKGKLAGKVTASGSIKIN